MGLENLMFRLNIGKEAKFTKLSYVSVSNRKPPPPPRPPSRALFGVGCGRELWLLMLGARGPSAPASVAAERCDGGTFSRLAVARVRLPSCQDAFPHLGSGDWSAESLRTPRRVWGKAWGGGKGKGEGRDGRRLLKDWAGMHGKRAGIWASRCLGQSGGICKSSSNVAGVGVGTSLATPVHRGGLYSLFRALIHQKCTSLSSANLQPAWVCWPEQRLCIQNMR